MGLSSSHVGQRWLTLKEFGKEMDAWEDASFSRHDIRVVVLHALEFSKVFVPANFSQTYNEDKVCLKFEQCKRFCTVLLGYCVEDDKPTTEIGVFRISQDKLQREIELTYYWDTTTVSEELQFAFEDALKAAIPDYEFDRYGQIEEEMTKVVCKLLLRDEFIGIKNARHFATLKEWEEDDNRWVEYSVRRFKNQYHIMRKTKFHAFFLNENLMELHADEMNVLITKWKP